MKASLLREKRKKGEKKFVDKEGREEVERPTDIKPSVVDTKESPKQRGKKKTGKADRGQIESKRKGGMSEVSLKLNERTNRAHPDINTKKTQSKLKVHQKKISKREKPCPGETRGKNDMTEKTGVDQREGKILRETQIKRLPELVQKRES